MWTDTYDYVRLHQPYQLFTAGNIKCTLGKELSPYISCRVRDTGQRMAICTGNGRPTKFAPRTTG